MKKYYLFFAILSFLIFAIFSCRKSSEPELNIKQMTVSSKDTEMKIKSFMKHLNDNLKDEISYSIDSAIWYSTAYLNYNFAIYDSSLIYLSRDTITFSIELDENNRISEANLHATVDQMTDSLTVVYDNLPAIVKHLVSCMVYEIEINPGRLELGLKSVLGWGYSSTYYGSFNSTDHWYSIWNYGDCFDFTRIGDATLLLEYKLMHPLVSNDPNWRLYTIPEEEYTTDMVFPDEFVYEPAPRGCRGFYYADDGNWSGPQCLPPSEMNFYISTNGIPYIIDAYQPQNLDFTEINIDGEVIFLWPDGFQEFHYYYITYAPIYETSVPASAL